MFAPTRWRRLRWRTDTATPRWWRRWRGQWRRRWR
uniref:Uncharacterized protein n=1 Tax=Arundo donax TaxID=35708 RepID=A0A0A9E002_ARUDO